MTFSRKSRILSIPRLEAASISITLNELPAVISRHCWQVLHGSPFTGLLQLMVLANRRAVLVLPVPRGPVKRYACARLPLLRAFLSVRIIGSCPTRSPNVFERHLRYRV